MKFSRLWLPIIFSSVALSVPVTYWVVSNDQTPSDFVKQVDTAFNAWKAIPATTLSLEKNKDSATQFAWGIETEGVPINPDTITRTITSSSEDGKTSTLVNVNPDQTENLEAGLLIEAGLRLGVPLEASTDNKRSLTPADALALRSVYSQNGDLNTDGKVNLDDLEILAASYGKKDKPETNLKGDFNGDGFVNDADLEIMKENYSFDVVAEKSLTPETPATPTPPATPTTPNTPTTPITPPPISPPITPPK